MEVAKQVDVTLGEHLACRPRSLSATDDAAAGCDDVDLVFDASGDPRAAGDDVSTIPKELGVYLRQLQVMLASEAAHMPSPHFIETTQQPHNGMLTSWRKSLTDWIIEFMVALEYTTETYSLAINFMDRFFSKVTVDQDCMQTLAIACCLTASKVQGERPIAMATIRDMFGASISIKHLKSVEVQVCSTLTFMLSSHVSQAFVDFFCTMIPTSLRHDIRQKALLAADLAMTDYGSLQFRPSVLGVACILCAFKVIGTSSQAFLNTLTAAKLGIRAADARACIPFVGLLVHKFYPEMCSNSVFYEMVAPAMESPTSVVDTRLTSPTAPSPAPIRASSTPTVAAPPPDADADGDIAM